MNKIYDLIQSDDRAIIKKVEYFIANIPAGKGCGTSSRDYESIMNKNRYMWIGPISLSSCLRFLNVSKPSRLPISPKKMIINGIIK